MLAMLFCLSLLTVVSLTNSVSFITPCTWDDEACILSSTRKALPTFVEGVPELNVAKLDPMFIDSVHINNDGIYLLLKDMKIEGAKQVEFIKISRDAHKGIHIEMTTPFRATGKYNVSGTLAGLDVYGNGDFDFNTEKIKLIVDAILLPTKGDDGKQHWKLDKVQYKYEIVKKLNFILHNLYDGDETKAKPILDFIDASWKDLIGSFGSPVIEKIVGTALTAVKNFFKAVPLDELEIQSL